MPPLIYVTEVQIGVNVDSLTTGVVAVSDLMPACASHYPNWAVMFGLSERMCLVL